MSEKIHIANAFIVNEGNICRGDVLTENEKITQVSLNVPLQTPEGFHYINAEGLYLFPGLIDDQVHFREPGLTHKADIYHESRAAVAGGVTSFMDMPNTRPAATTLEVLEAKYALAAKSSVANYSFYMGVTNDNVAEVLQTPLNSVCGLKMFLGSSTGNLLVNNPDTIEKIFASTKHVVAVHCEEDQIIQDNLKYYSSLYGENIPVTMHHKIRNAEACMVSSSRAVALARKYKTRLHVLHISTTDELTLFDANIPLEEKHIISEVCVHHLWFTADDYEKHGNFIKWNPSIKEPHHREGLRKALTTGAVDMVATDHAPHLAEEKNNSYSKSPSGAPVIQFSLQIMLELARQKVIQLEDITRLMCHNPAKLFSIHKRGFIRSGYFADLVLVDLNTQYTVEKEKLLSKCGWSPLEGTVFNSAIDTTIINGTIAWQKDRFNDSVRGKRLLFDR